MQRRLTRPQLSSPRVSIGGGHANPTCLLESRTDQVREAGDAGGCNLGYIYDKGKTNCAHTYVSKACKVGITPLDRGFAYTVDKMLS